MTNAQSTSQKDSLGNMLSAEAKVFVPRQQQGSTDVVENGLLSPGAVGTLMTDGLLDGEGLYPGQHPINGLPGYITTCYPFVNGAEPRYPGPRAGVRGKYPMMAPPQVQQMHSGGPRNRFPHPSKNYIPQGHWGPTPGPLPGVIPTFPNMPSGMPFDGGTYPPNGFIRPPLVSPNVPVHDPKSFAPANHQFPNSICVDSFSPYVENHKLVNGVIDPAKLWNRSNQEEKEMTDRGDADKSSSDCQKICLKDSSIQTEFPESIANSSLTDFPNTLFNTRHRSSKSRNSSNAKHSNCANGEKRQSFDADLDETFPGALNRSNLVSSGTNPHGNGYYGTELSVCMTPPNHVINYVNNPYIHATAMQSIVPENFKYSYASVAQSKPSQKNSPFVSTTTKSDNPTCDKSSSKSKVKHNTNLSLNNVNINVACIIKDLETAQERERQEWRATAQKLYTWADRKEEKFKSSHSGHLKQVDVKITKGQSVSFKSNPSAKSSNPSAKTDISKPLSGGDDLEKVQSEGHDLSEGEGQNEQTEGQNEAQVGKKKRRRKRRRKKKNAGGGEGNEEGNSGANEDVNLHFEDEDEFPDLSTAMGDASKSSPNTGVLSYSDILKNSSLQQTVGTDQTAPGEDDQADNQTENNGALVKESRNSRKRRKRREVANKAADAELAEINLEQHMLELKMKQKQPLVPKKSVSPVRNVSPQRVWKAPINQASPASPAPPQSTSVKKVSLLLPATVAMEPSPATARPSSPVAKQPGILKMPPQPQAPSNSGGKKSKQPIAFDLGAMIDALEQKKEQPPPPPKKEVVVIRKDDLKSVVVNPLDASAPTLKRGKERETPKAKKHSPLKKVILKEREEKKRLRMLDEEEPTTGIEIEILPSTFPTTPISAPVGIGVVSGESDLSQDASGSKSMVEIGIDNPPSAELSPISQPSPSCLSLSPGPSPLGSGGNSPVTGSFQVKLKIHSRRFREYCNQILDKEIDNCCATLLSDLVRFQDRQYHKDPLKAKAKRRIVLGLREVTKHLKLRKIKCVIISPNLEKIQSKGGLDEALNIILDLCSEQEVPFVFALGRRALGRACAKLVPVSVVGVFSYEGSEENFKQLVDLTEKARESYREMISQIELEMKEYPPRHATPGVPHVFAHYGHSRTPSGCSVLSFTSSILSEPISENYPYSEPETDKYGNEIEKSKAKTSADDDENDIDEDDDENDKNIENGYEGDDEDMTNEPELENKQTMALRKRMNSSVSNSVISGDNDLVPKIVNPDSPAASENALDENDNEENGISDPKDLSFVETNSENDLTEEELTEEADTVLDLPTVNKSYIDSIYNYDLNLHEILSQQSSTEKTVGENVEEISNHSSKTTHSSRTFGDGSVLNDKKSITKVDIKNSENTALTLKGKSAIDKKSRTLSWVQETQQHHFKEDLENENDNKDDSDSSKLVDAVA